MSKLRSSTCTQVEVCTTDRHRSTFSLQSHVHQIILNVNAQQPRFCARRKFNPSEWEVINNRTEMSGIQFHQKGTRRGDSQWPPEGMTAAKILALPGAKAYWGTIAEVEAYLLDMEQVVEDTAGNYYDYVCEEWKDVDDGSDGNKQGDEDEVCVLVNVIID